MILRNGEFLVLGLTEASLRLVKSGEAILVSAEKSGVPNLQMIIMYRETEDAWRADLCAHGFPADEANDSDYDGPGGRGDG